MPAFRAVTGGFRQQSLTGWMHAEEGKGFGGQSGARPSTSLFEGSPGRFPGRIRNKRRFPPWRREHEHEEEGTGDVVVWQRSKPLSSTMVPVQLPWGGLQQRVLGCPAPTSPGAAAGPGGTHPAPPSPCRAGLGCRGVQFLQMLPECLH